MFKGIKYFIIGLGLIFKKGIRPFVIIPLFINITLFTAVIFYLLLKFQVLTEMLNIHVIAKLPEWLQWLEWLIIPMVIILAIIAIFVILAWIGNFIGSFFNEKLSASVEYHLTGKFPHPLSSISIAVTVKEIIGTIVHILFWVSILLILSFIPLINLISPFLWLAFSGWLLTLEYTSYVRDNHSYTPSEQRKLLKNKKLLSFSFGGIVLAMTLFPIVNLFIMPIAVAGATAMWVREFPD
jgi:CysZ protein